MAIHPDRRSGYSFVGISPNSNRSILFYSHHIFLLYIIKSKNHKLSLGIFRCSTCVQLFYIRHTSCIQSLGAFVSVYYGSRNRDATFRQSHSAPYPLHDSEIYA